MLLIRTKYEQHIIVVGINPEFIRRSGPFPGIRISSVQKRAPFLVDLIMQRIQT